MLGLHNKHKEAYCRSRRDKRMSMFWCLNIEEEARLLLKKTIVLHTTH